MTVVNTTERPEGGTVVMANTRERPEDRTAVHNNLCMGHSILVPSFTRSRLSQNLSFTSNSANWHRSFTPPVSPAATRITHLSHLMLVKIVHMLSSLCCVINFSIKAMSFRQLLATINKYDQMLFFSSPSE